MDDNDKTKDQLIRELKELRGQVDELEKSDAVLREADRKIRESENRYRSLFENAADAIYLIHTETLKILDCNPEASRIIGYTIKEIKTMTVEDLHPAEEQDVVLKIFKKISERGSLSGISGINQLRKDEKLVPVEINASTIELKGEKYSLCIIRDVTRQKQAAEARQKSEEKYRNFFNYTNDSFFIIDPASRRFLDINDNAAKRLGYTKKELLNLTIAVFRTRQ
jgi:PAS domain S-box-containing protein